jgi:hypothetical protein
MQLASRENQRRYIPESTLQRKSEFLRNVLLNILSGGFKYDIFSMELLFYFQLYRNKRMNC